MIALLREAGYDAPIYLHGALIALCELYEELRRRSSASCGPPPAPTKDELRGADRHGAAVGASTTAGRGACPIRWSALASGWMRVKQRAKQRGVELPLVISDHADWDELTQTIDEVGAEKSGSRMGARRRWSTTRRQQGLEARARCALGRLRGRRGGRG